MYTDGLIEGRIGPGPERLGIERLIGIVDSFLRATPTGRQPSDERLLDLTIDHVRELNGGDLDDDLAVLALGAHPWTRND